MSHFVEMSRKIPKINQLKAAYHFVIEGWFLYTSNNCNIESYNISYGPDTLLSTLHILIYFKCQPALWVPIFPLLLLEKSDSTTIATTITTTIISILKYGKRCTERLNVPTKSCSLQNLGWDSISHSLAYEPILSNTFFKAHDVVSGLSWN